MKMSIFLHFSIFFRRHLVIHLSYQSAKWIIFLMYQNHTMEPYFRQQKNSPQLFRGQQGVRGFVRLSLAMRYHTVTITWSRQIQNEIWIWSLVNKQIWMSSKKCKKLSCIIWIYNYLATISSIIADCVFSSSLPVVLMFLDFWYFLNAARVCGDILLVIDHW